ncbi:MAG: hypothetical protein HC831_11530 [Chloroflexia bacterium]|nr:hypothetical protein [Chloroflexia bacterium]
MDNYVGLIFGCPSDTIRDDCPFNFFREMEKEEAFKMWSNLTEHKKRKIIDLHRACPNSCKKKLFRRKIIS